MIARKQSVRFFGRHVASVFQDSRPAGIPSGSAADRALDSSTDPYPAAADPTLADLAGRCCVDTAMLIWLRDWGPCSPASCVSFLFSQGFNSLLQQPYPPVGVAVRLSLSRASRLRMAVSHHG